MTQVIVAGFLGALALLPGFRTTEPVAPSEPTALSAKAGTCPSGQACNLDCAEGRCQHLCIGASTCTASCAGGTCDQTCAGGANCKFTCTGGGCKQMCAGGANCNMVCTGDKCAQTCAGGSNCKKSIVKPGDEKPKKPGTKPAPAKP